MPILLVSPVHEPWYSVLGAAILGFVAGLISGRLMFPHLFRKGRQ